MRKQNLFAIIIAALVAFVGVNQTYAQVVTSGSLSGVVVDQTGMTLPGATVIALHEPSGTQYGAATDNNGRYQILGVRVGGPYKVTVSFIGYNPQTQDGINIGLGAATNLNFQLSDAATLLEEFVVTFDRSSIFSSNRTGASTSIGQNEIQSLPSFSRRIGDFTRLTPMASGSSFAGADNRLNNITVDGSSFNNSFGLGGQPGDRTGVAPISMSAIEAISVNIAPYDVRQANFVGANVNTVTKSGTNVFKGEASYTFHNSNMVGRQASEQIWDPGNFSFNQYAVNLGGPIIKNKLFFFVDFQQEMRTSPGTTFLANTGGQTVSGNITRVLASDLNALSTYLKNNFQYETGPYQGYDHETPALRLVAKVDFNLDDRNKFSLRYNHLDSEADILLSNSSSLGWGTRRSNLNGLNFQNSNYQIIENIRSIVGEWNSRIGKNMFNNMIVGYTYQDESRKSRGAMFPMVDILEGGNVYTTFGFEPFTPNNELRYKTFQFQNNFSYFMDNHTLTFGISAERYESENVFFPGSQSVYVYNSLANFYTDANGYLANPNRTVSPVSLRRFQVRWSNIPGMEKPIQPLKVFYAGIYGQDEWKASDKLTLTAGLRIDIPFFGKGEHINPNVPGMAFRDENDQEVRFSTEKLPDPRPHFSPRLGFNYDVDGNGTTQLRGGTGIFTGTPAYVWISNQMGANGMLTGFERLDNTTARPFHPDPNRYKPTTVTGAPASSYELAFTDPKFKFPQIWRTNIAVDQKLPFGFIGTLEGLYSKDVNGIYYINANLVKPTATFSGPDQRLLYQATSANNRIHANIDNNIVLKNQSKGYAYNFAVSLERPFTKGLFMKAAYSYGIAKNTVDPGSIAFGSWNNNQHSGDPNNPGLGFSSNSAGHRAIGVLSYKTRGSTTFSLFFESRTLGNFSYVYSGDMNRDGGTSNDLIYIPKDKSEMNFFAFTVGTRTFTVQEQEDAWEAFINQDKYLSKNRGKYAERGGAFLPMVSRVDFSITHDLATNIGGSKNTLSVNFLVANLGNLLNKEWGVAEVAVVTNPLVMRGTPLGPVDTNNKPIYRLANVGSGLISKSTQQSLLTSDVYRIQIGLFYKFN